MQEIKISGVDETIYYDETEEGLPIYMWSNKRISNYYITLNVKYGSIGTEYTVDGKKKVHTLPNGVAHFLEHMKFYNPDGDVFTAFEKNGASVNAFTTYDMTAYEVYGNDKFQENLKELIHYVYTPYFRKEDIKKERGIITEEIHMGKDDPYKAFYEALYKATFHEDKRRNSIAGEVEDIKKITEETLMEVYDTFYHPKNMFLVITGAFNPYEAAGLVKEEMKKHTFQEYRNPKLKEIKEPASVHDTYLEIKGNVKTPTVRVVLKIPKKSIKIKNEDYLNTCCGLLLRANFGTTSDLKEDLKNKGLILRMSYGFSVIGDYLTCSVLAETDYPEEWTVIIKEKLQHLSIDEALLKRRVRANISSLIRKYDDLESVNSDIEDDIVKYGKIRTNLYEIYRNVSIEDIKALIKAMESKEIATIVLKPSED